MFWGRLSVQGSFILRPPNDQADEDLLYKTGLPILSPPDAPASIPHEVITMGDYKEASKGIF